MKKTLLILLTTIFYNLSSGQSIASIAFMKMDWDKYFLYLNDAIVDNLNKGGLTAK